MKRDLWRRCESAVLLFVGASGCVNISNEDVGFGDSASDAETASDGTEGSDADSESDASDSESAATDDEATDPGEMVPRRAVFAPTVTTQTIPVTTAYQPGTDGFVSIRNRWVNDAYRDSSVDGQFFYVEGPDIFEISVKFIVEAQGVDDCSLGIYLETGIGTADENNIDWLNAGEVTLTANDILYPLDWAYINEESRSVRYFFYDFPEEVSGSLRGPIGIIATGDETPAFEPGVIEAMMPDELTLFQPAQDDVIKKGPMQIEWSAGTESNTVSIIMMVFRKTNESAAGYQMEDVHEIHCTVVDDGEFEIPASIMDQLPADYAANLYLSRENAELRTVASDFAVRLSVSENVQIEMQIPSTLIP